MDRNVVRQSFQAKHNAFDSWRQVVEVIFAISPTDVMPVDKKQSILVEILRELIPKVSSFLFFNILILLLQRVNCYIFYFLFIILFLKA